MMKIMIILVIAIEICVTLGILILISLSISEGFYKRESYLREEYNDFKNDSREA